MGVGRSEKTGGVIGRTPRNGKMAPIVVPTGIMLIQTVHF